MPHYKTLQNGTEADEVQAEVIVNVSITAMCHKLAQLVLT